MSMRGKPADIDAFRNGGDRSAAATPAKPASAPVAAPAVQPPKVQAPAIDTPPPAPERRNKTIRIRKDFEARLKDEAYERTKRRGSSVAESDLIDEALADFFAKLDASK